MSIKFADISEFQTSFDANAYLKAGHPVIICRAHNGYRPDKMMPGRITQVRAAPFTAVGYYQYVAADRDAAQQAHEFIGVVGKLHDNEFAVADIEEGSGAQAGRADAWFRIVDPWAGHKATLYSGASFLGTNLGGFARYLDRPRWIAAYPSSYTANVAVYPQGATFWQYSDRERFTGLPGTVDGNYYPKTAAQLRAEVCGGPAPAPAPKPAPDQTITTITQADGDLQTFVLHDDGTVWTRTMRQGKWAPGWTKLGKPGG